MVNLFSPRHALVTEPRKGPATAAEDFVSRFGLTEVYRPPSGELPQVDIVLVHGMNGHPRRTWTSKNNGVFWPKDLLPEFIQDQQARVLVYGYDADVASLGGAGVSKDKIHSHAERLVADLFANRRIRKATERPIVFVVHSLGGLIVKRALIWSSEISGSKIEHLRSIYVSTYGILFLGTPHRGSDVAKWGTYLSWLCQSVLPSKLVSSESQLIEALQTNSETLLNIDRQFAQLMDDFHIFFFHEAKPTDLKGTLRYIVDEESAAPLLPDVERAGIQADHSHMCKFDDASAPGFDLVVDGLQRYADQASNIIRNRWVTERQERLTRAVRKAKENYNITVQDASEGVDRGGHTPAESSSEMPSSSSTPNESIHGSSTSPKTFEPYFIVPPGFRANTVFVGMEKELDEIDRKLFDEGRKDGTNCVLLHGQPGAGKTHVARQYVYKNRTRFSGGVFWVNAHLLDEIFKDYWQIHQKVVAKSSAEQTRCSTEGNDRSFVDEVREWFSDRQEWLIVLDGISIERDQDINILQRCIPDSPNCGIIYVSRSKRLENMQRLLRPQSIKVSGLSKVDAQELLFKEMSIRSPTPAQVTAAKALVKKVGGLPLAISAIARRLSDTHEPIEKFHLKSYSEDLNLGLTYQRIMNDLQRNGHREATNLMNIICFLESHIPVEMIHLGLKALHQEHVNVRASDGGSRGDLNITLGILMRHALIERNEPDDSESMSSSRNGIIEPEPIDVLNVHAVIQQYWCDSIHTAKQLPLWLGRAIKLLSTSFHEADQRIRQQEKPGRLSDYRWYLVHARRLKYQCKQYQSRHQRLSDLKADIEALIAKIEAEITMREPGSSQESLDLTEFQSSIFDRTAGSSSSGQSQASFTDSTPSPAATQAENPFTYLGLDQLSNRVLDNQVISGNVQYPIAYTYVGDGIATPSAQNGPTTRPSLMAPRRSSSFRSASAAPITYPRNAVGLVAAAPLAASGTSAEPSGAASSLAYLRSLHPLKHRDLSPRPASSQGLSNIHSATIANARSRTVSPSYQSHATSETAGRLSSGVDSPVSSVASPTPTQASLNAGVNMTPIDMSRDISNQTVISRSGEERPILVQPAVVLDPSMGMEALKLVENSLAANEIIPISVPLQQAALLEPSVDFQENLRGNNGIDSEVIPTLPLRAVIPGIVTNAPHSDPLPSAVPIPIQALGPNLRRESVPTVPVDGLGITTGHGNDRLPAATYANVAHQRLPQEQIGVQGLDLRFQRDMQRSAKPLADRDPNIGLRNQVLGNKPDITVEEDRKWSQSELTGANFVNQTVSFAAPTHLRVDPGPNHRRASSAAAFPDPRLENLHSSLQVQPYRSLQQSFALLPSHSVMSLTPIESQEGMSSRQSALDYTDAYQQAYGTTSLISPQPGRNASVSGPTGLTASLAPPTAPRRRTLSAPETPGVGITEQGHLWGQ